jgi:hypothetical protein
MWTSVEKVLGAGCWVLRAGAGCSCSVPGAIRNRRACHPRLASSFCRASEGCLPSVAGVTSHSERRMGRWEAVFRRPPVVHRQGLRWDRVPVAGCDRNEVAAVKSKRGATVCTRKRPENGWISSLNSRVWGTVRPPLCSGFLRGHRKASREGVLGHRSAKRERVSGPPAERRCSRRYRRVFAQRRGFSPGWRPPRS